MTVFIVEDSLMMRARLIEICNELGGINVAGTAETSQDAIDAIETLKPDVVLLDIQLRTGNGFDVLRSVKRRVPSPFVIVLTNFSYPKYREASMNLGADAFLHKATEFDDVSVILERLKSLIGQ